MATRKQNPALPAIILGLFLTLLLFLFFSRKHTEDSRPQGVTQNLLQKSSACIFLASA